MRSRAGDHMGNGSTGMASTLTTMSKGYVGISGTDGESVRVGDEGADAA